MDSVRFLRVSLEKDLQSEKRNCVTSLGDGRKKTTPQRSADLVFMLGVPRNRYFLSMQFTDGNGHPLENEDESGRRLCEYWSKIFEARVPGEQHHCYETILEYVQKTPDDIRWETDKNECDELLATKKESAPGPDGIPYSLYRCAGGLGSTFLFKVYQHTYLLAARSFCSLLQVGPSSFDCKILTTAICRGRQWCTMRCIPPSQRCISSRQMTDNTSEVETNNCAWRTWRGHLFHDLKTQVFRRSLEYGIVVLGVLDAFVYAHNYHRRNIDNLEISVIA